MTPRKLELAAQFCELVDAANLFAYVGADPGDDPADALDMLRARRRRMQGMQSNPKYKDEALFLIKNFSVLEEVVRDRDAHLADMRRRAEAAQIPIIEMTIKGVLAGGTLSPEQEEYLRQSAVELGVSARTFEEVLARLATEASVRLPSPMDTSDLPLGPTSLYAVLGIVEIATEDEIEAAYARKMVEAHRISDATERRVKIARLGEARGILTDPEARSRYDLSLDATGPPARRREYASFDGLTTAPPIRVSHMLSDPDARPARLEILDEPTRNVRVGSKPVVETISIRNGGDAPLTGTITSRAPWLVVEDTQIDPNATEQQIRVRIEPARIGGSRADGVVTIAPDGAAVADVWFHVTTSGRRRWPLGCAAAAAIAVAGGAAWLGLSTQSGPDETIIRVDPMATDVRLDGVSLGSGSRFAISVAPPGPAELTVTHPNFETWFQRVDLRRQRGELVVRLQLANPLEFEPTSEMARATVNESVAKQIMGPRSLAMDRCILEVAEPGRVLEGKVYVHIGADGRAVGLKIEGDEVASGPARECVEREAAAVVFDPLEGGDYATVRYDYSVTAEPAGQ